MEYMKKLLLVVCMLCIHGGVDSSWMREGNRKLFPVSGVGEDVDDFLRDSRFEPRRLFKKPAVGKRDATGTCTCTCDTAVVEPVNTTSGDGGVEDQEGRKAVMEDQEGRKAGDRGRLAVAAANLRTAASSGASDSSAYRSSSSDQVVGNTARNRNDKTRVMTLYDQELKDRLLQNDWGHESRFSWRRLPDMDCYRDPCSSDKDCCSRYNLCDQSAKVCVDCWHGSPCTSERECCLRFPLCKKDRKSIGDDHEVGQCVNEF